MSGNASPRMPNFFVIGANRAGTTSLHQYLGQHPDVYMSPHKEPKYFAPKSPEERAQWPEQVPSVTGLDDYQALFSGVAGESAVGESSTIYLASKIAPARIREAVPDARLVAVLRNPADRAFSDYCLHRRWGTEPLSFADAVSAELDHDGPVAGRMRGYVGAGFYGRSLTRYLEHFDRARLRVFLYEDFVADPGGVVRDVFEFLEVDPSVAVDTSARRNATRHEPKHRSVDRVARSRTVQSLARNVLPSGLRVRAREFLRRNNSVPPEYPDEVRRRLVEVYRDDVAVTAELISRDLSAWKA